MKHISGKIVDVIHRSVIEGTLIIDDNVIVDIVPASNVPDCYIIPGFVDSHIHIESSMMVPSEFARYSMVHGTLACVCDPHEIANVCGVEGVDFMIEDGRKSPMKFYFGAPSCVPATIFETSGAVLDADAVEALLKRDDIHFLGEMMDYPGVINGNDQVMAKIKAALKNGKPVDGHAPDISDESLKIYAAAGITTDHECMTIDEAVEKINLGMKVLIREGSAAKNFDDLLPLMADFADDIMFCSDDKHPDDLIKSGHINQLARRAIAAGYDPISVLRVCSLNPVKHYKLDVGLLQVGDKADFLIVDDLRSLKIQEAYVDGVKIVADSAVLVDQPGRDNIINAFNACKLEVQQLSLKINGNRIKVINVDDGQLYTHVYTCVPLMMDGNVVSDVENDVLKMVVYNRYKASEPAIGFIKSIGLKKGAFASTVAHDSHNIVAVGTSDAEIVSAINHIVETQGGIVAVDGERWEMLPLPVGGLMSTEKGDHIADQYEKVDAMVKELGANLHAPFMTLAFMSLLVIPELKLSDKGLFDGRLFQLVDVFE